MQASISCHTIDGEIRSVTYEPYTRSEALLTDALGSVVRKEGPFGGADYRYSAYGGLIKATPGYLTPYIGWVGSLGYRETNLDHAEQYIRARHYSTTDSRWTTRDPLWPSEPAFGYVRGQVTRKVDPTGMQSQVLCPPKCKKPTLPPSACVPVTYTTRIGLDPIGFTYVTATVTSVVCAYLEWDSNCCAVRNCVKVTSEIKISASKVLDYELDFGCGVLFGAICLAVCLPAGSIANPICGLICGGVTSIVGLLCPNLCERPDGSRCLKFYFNYCAAGGGCSLTTPLCCLPQIAISTKCC